MPIAWAQRAADLGSVPIPLADYDRRMQEHDVYEVSRLSGFCEFADQEIRPRVDAPRVEDRHTVLDFIRAVPLNEIIVTVGICWGVWGSMFVWGSIFEVFVFCMFICVF